jgi:type IX secretion system PorP/SprF family membrane protein
MKKNYALIGLMMTMLAGFAQDPIFYNTNQSLVYLNPSFAGSNGFIRNQTAYRNQWPNLSGTYVTYYNGYDMFFKSINAGMAINYTLDDQSRGTLRTETLNFTFAQYFYMCDKKLKIIPSIQFGGFRKQVDLGRLNFGQTIGGATGTSPPWPNNPSSKKSNFDLSSGLLVNYKGFYFGTSVFHMTQPDEGLFGASKLPYRLSIHTSYNVTTSPRTLVNFFVRYDKQQSFNYLNLKVNALFMNHLVTGAGYSTNDVVNLNVGYRHNYFVLSAGYDVSVSKLSGNTAGSWEIQASFNLRTKENRKTITYFETW